MSEPTKHNWHANQILNCNAKVRHRSEADALACQGARSALGKNCRAISAYECPVCRGWHMTSEGAR